MQKTESAVYFATGDTLTAITGGKAAIVYLRLGDYVHKAIDSAGMGADDLREFVEYRLERFIPERKENLRFEILPAAFRGAKTRDVIIAKKDLVDRLRELGPESRFACLCSGPARTQGDFARLVSGPDWLEYGEWATDHWERLSRVDILPGGRVDALRRILPTADARLPLQALHFPETREDTIESLRLAGIPTDRATEDFARALEGRGRRSLFSLNRAETRVPALTWALVAVTAGLVILNAGMIKSRADSIGTIKSYESSLALARRVLGEEAKLSRQSRTGAENDQVPNGETAIRLSPLGLLSALTTATREGGRIDRISYDKGAFTLRATAPSALSFTGALSRVPGVSGLRLSDVSAAGPGGKGENFTLSGVWHDPE